MPLPLGRCASGRSARSELCAGLGRIRIWQSPDEGRVYGVYPPGGYLAPQYSWCPEPEPDRSQVRVHYRQILRVSANPVLLYVPPYALFHALRFRTAALRVGSPRILVCLSIVGAFPAATAKPHTTDPRMFSWHVARADRQYRGALLDRSQARTMSF